VVPPLQTPLQTDVLGFARREPATWSREDRERRERGSRWRCLLEDAVTSGLLIMRPSVFHLSHCGVVKRKRKEGNEH
jgi:hypothetical protein